MTLLTDGKAKNLTGAWSYSRRFMAYLSARRDGRDLDLYRIDPSNPMSDRLLAPLGGEAWSVQSWSPDDRRILLDEYRSDGSDSLWLLEVATREKRLLTPRSRTEAVYYGGGVFRRDGRGIYIITDRGSEFQRLATIDLATRQLTFVTRPGPWDVSSFAPSPNGKIIAFVTNEDGASILHLLDTATGKEKPAPRLPVGIIRGLGWRRGGRELGFTFESAHFPADAYSLDVQNGTVDRWTNSRAPGLHAEHFAEPELIRWRSFDGRWISGFLYRPPARFTGKRPVVISIHGGPESQARPAYLGASNYWLNELGVTLILPNVRGSSGYGKTFLQLDDRFRRVDAYRDIGALLDWIKTRPDLDPDRVMVTGASYGGHMALAVAARYSDRIRCTIDESGPSNVLTLLETVRSGRDLWHTEYGDERDPKMRSFLAEIAPLNSAWKIRKPLFVVQGANDPRVPLSEAQQMVAAVRRNGTPVWYLLARDEGHGFFKLRNVNYLYYARVLFMKEYLLN